MTDGPRACPRTGRSRGLPLPPGGVRPSDMLVAFFALAVTWLAAAAVAAGVAFLGGVEDARWVALHLAFVGGVSQLVLGAAQFFVCAFLATDPPSKRTIRAELGLWNAGTILVAVGVPAGVTPLSGVGGTLLIAALAVFAGAGHRHPPHPGSSAAGKRHRGALDRDAAPRVPRPPFDHRFPSPQAGAVGVCRALQHAPPPPIARSAPARRLHCPALRRDHPATTTRPARRPFARVRARRMT